MIQSHQPCITTTITKPLITRIVFEDLARLFSYLARSKRYPILRSLIRRPLLHCQLPKHHQSARFKSDLFDCKWQVSAVRIGDRATTCTTMIYDHSHWEGPAYVSDLIRSATLVHSNNDKMPRGKDLLQVDHPKQSDYRGCASNFCIFVFGGAQLARWFAQ